MRMRSIPPLWREPAIAFEAAQLIRSGLFRTKAPIGRDQDVMLIPGLFAPDESLMLMARWLRRRGYRPRRSGIAINVDCSERAVSQLGDRLHDIYRQAGGRPVLIVGHSRGGLLGRVLASRHPDMVAGLVTLGSPHVRCLEAMHPLLKAHVAMTSRLGDAGLRQVATSACAHGRGCCERFMDDLGSVFPAHARFTSIYTRTDGVIDWRACLDRCAVHVEVSSTHLGMACNASVFAAVSDALERTRPAAAARQSDALPPLLAA